MQNRYLIGLGSSHPQAEHYLKQALAHLTGIVSIVSQSDIERSGGVGTDEPLVFLNQVVVAESPLSATALWFELSLIETKLGRIRTKVNAARTIDLDILYGLGFENKDDFITMPHPRFFERRFARDLSIRAGLERIMVLGPSLGDTAFLD